MTYLSHCADIIPFVYFLSLMVVFLMGAIEGVLMILGFGMSSIIDEFFPDVDVEMDVPDTGSAISEGLTWLNKGRVPVVILFIIYLSTFGTIGAQIHCLYPSTYLMVSLPVVFILSILITRVLSGWLGKIMPKDETVAVKTETFIGNIATITLGTATIKDFVEAKTEDIYGKTHYIMIRAEEENDRFKQSEEVVIFKKLENDFFTAISKEESKED